MSEAIHSGGAEGHEHTLLNQIRVAGRTAESWRWQSVADRGNSNNEMHTRMTATGIDHQSEGPSDHDTPSASDSLTQSSPASTRQVPHVDQAPAAVRRGTSMASTICLLGIAPLRTRGRLPSQFIVFYRLLAVHTRRGTSMGISYPNADQSVNLEGPVLLPGSQGIQTRRHSQ